MSRRIDYLIEQIRKQTENEDDIGISDSEFIEYLNDAHHRLQSVIEARHPNVFQKEKVIPTFANQSTYDLPDDAYMENKISNIQYSITGDDQDYYNIERFDEKRRDDAFSGSPTGYIRRSGQIILQPKPQSNGNIRLLYIKRIDEVDLLRGKIESVTTSGNSITSLKIDASISNPRLDAESLNKHTALCVVDRNGKVKMRNIEFDSVDATTGDVTISSGFTFEDGESIATGDLIVGGRDTSSHSPLPRMAERYLKAYVAWRILKRDSSIDYAEQQQELLAMESDIINSYSEVTDDVIFITKLTSWEDWD